MQQEELIQSLQQENAELKRKFRNQENEWNKEKAILMQKIEIYQIQIQESKVREEHLKKMNDTFMNTISEPPEKSSSQLQSKFIIDLQKSFESNNRDAIESKGKMQEYIAKQEFRIREMEELLHEKELFIKDIENKKDKQIMQLQNRLIEAQANEALLDSKIQKLLADAKYRKDINQFENSAIVKELNQQILQIKQENKKEIEKLKSQHETEIKKIKQLNQQKKSYSVEDGHRSPISKIQQQKIIDDLEFKHRDEKKKLKSQIQNLESSLKSQKDKNQNLMQYQENYEQVQQDLSSLNEEIQKILTLNSKYQQQILEMEQNEQSLKCEIVNLSAQLEESRVLNDRLQQQMKMQETACLGLNFKDDSEIQQSPCNPTIRMGGYSSNTSLTNTRQNNNNKSRDEYVQLTLNPMDKHCTTYKQSLPKQFNDKENIPDVTHFSVAKNPNNFRVQDLIQKIQIQESRSNRPPSVPLIQNQDDNLKHQMQSMICKIKEAKKKIKHTSEHENTIIRQSVQRIRQRSVNNSIVTNYDDTLKELEPHNQTSFQDEESVIIKKPITNQQTNSSFNLSLYEDNFKSLSKHSKPNVAQTPYLQELSYRSRYNQANNHILIN